MDLEASILSRHGILERMLVDDNAEPTDLPLSLLESITDCFSLDCQIGSGGFAVVYKGKVGNGMVAVKKLTRTIDVVHENKFHKEVECLMKAKHKNIVRFLGYCAEAHGRVEDYEGKFVMADRRNWLLCFEYVPNGSLEKYITDASSGLEWKERFQIIRGICEGLHYLHMNRILHLDLKPANILLDGHMVPKIADFGISRSLDEEKTHGTTKHLSGTPGYLAPEFYRGKFMFASDIYSLGVIIMEILTGLKGYPEDENVIDSWMNRLDGGMQLEQVRVCTKIGIECMESDPKKRPVVRSIIDMLDETASADETRASSSIYELRLSSLKEKSVRERIGELVGRLEPADTKERSETEDIEERPGNDHPHQREERAAHWSSWEEQDTEQKVKRKGKIISRSNSGVLDKLKIWNFFKRDGRRNLARYEGQVPQIRGLMIFTMEEIKKITRNYLEILCQGGFAIVYGGTLPDYTRVAVKYFRPAYTNEEFVSGVEIQTQMIHKNILKLVGYCLEADGQISVHEYAANGNLSDILHRNKNQMLPIDLCLDIAIGSAEGLRYLHSADIRHGDVKPAKILLDEKFIPKICGFELSQIINVDGSESGTLAGTPGYICPVFYRTSHLTLESDVYGFGALLLELITRKKILYLDDDNSRCNLAVDYRKCYEKEKNGRAMFNEKFTAAEDMFVLEEMGKLAMECLRYDIQDRPDMMEVTNRLVMLRRDRKAQLEL
uniref:Uncharacterized protein n=1 Tax=Avena sativa TaxID=4498 RepID=A0ACD5TZ56_AVESA